MKKILRISAFMLFALIGVHLSFAATTREKYSLKVTAGVASSDYSKGKVAAQFEKISSSQSSTWNGSGYVATYEYSKSAPTPPATFNHYRTSGLTYDATFNNYYYEGGIDMGVYLYAEPYVRTNSANEVIDGDVGYAFDYWEITSDDGINMKSYVQNLYFVWNHKNKPGDDPNNPTQATLTAVAHFKDIDTTPKEEIKVQGYFRIQNEKTGKYVDVTGPFTAAPSLDYDQAENSAGTIMYVEAVEDGDSYRLTHLRSQGIDVVATDRLSSDEYTNTLADLQDLVTGAISGDNNFNDIAYGLVRKGFTHGYTNIARATVGTVFWIVAGALGERMDGAEAEDGYTYDDYIAVAENFNKYVTATLDLGIRMKPVEGKENTVQVYFDVPSFQCVSNWYNTRFATIKGGANRHDVFASAMRSMSSFLKNRFKMNLETFYAADIKLFKDWGYDMTKDYTVNEEGNIELDFDKIFSDPILLFNWIKMVGYYIINPDEDSSHGLSGLGFGDLAGNLDQHYLTGMLKSYLPRLHHNSRAYLINGRVGADNQAGGKFDESKVGTLGFASGAELVEAGNYANWKLCAIDNKEQKFVVSHKHKGAQKTTTTGTDTFGASAFYFDFPVEVPENSGTSLFTIEPELYNTTIDNTAYTFAMVNPLEGTVAAKTPFLMKSVEGTAQLIIPNDNWVFGQVAYNGVAAVNDDQEEAVQPNSMMGVLLRTSLEGDNFKNLWDGDVDDIYTLNQYTGKYSNMMFSKSADTKYLNANEAVYIISSMPEQPIEITADEAKSSLDLNFVYIGEPEQVDVPEPEVPVAVTKIKGYYRIQNVGNDKYVEVSGPFTARPDLSLKEAENSAGTIMYVEAVQDGDADSYRITHLRSQGIDVVGVEDFDADSYTEVIGGLLDDVLNAGDDLFNSIAYGLVRKGFTYGYTNIGRAAIGSVFWIVASALEKHSTDLTGVYEFEDGDYIAVAEDFNREVTAKLDLGIRMKPVLFEDKTMQVYFDVPSFKPVCDWYNDRTATISTEKNRHDVFASAMMAMSKYMPTRGLYLETFTQDDIDLFKDWGYQFPSKYEQYKDGDEYNLTFDLIFSDEVLLFNWIKMIGYYVFNPEDDKSHGVGKFFGGANLGEAASQHYLTDMLVSYLPRIHHNSRAYLINGRVGADNQAGGDFIESKVGTLGFASESELEKAGDYANWKLCPMDNEKQKFVVKHKYQEVTRTGQDNQNELTFGTSALYFDFPIEVEDPNTELYTLGADLCTTIFDNKTYVYNRVEKLNDRIERLTPFLVKTSDKGEVQLIVCNDDWFYNKLGEETAATENTYGEVKPYSLVQPLYLTDNEDTSLRGVLLSTSLNNNDLANLWGGDVTDVYPFNEATGIEEVNGSDGKHVGFNATKRNLDANEAVYVPSANNNYIWVDTEEAKKQLQDSFVYIGEPVDTSLSGVTVPEMEEGDNIIYDLRGIRVDKPQPGNIYILNGRKFLAK